MLAVRWIAVPLSMLFWATCVLIVIAWTPLMAVARLVTRGSDPDRYRIGRLFHDTAVWAVRLNPFWKFRVVQEFRPDPRRPYLFVANHVSNADVFLLAMLPWEMKWLSKQSIFDIPLLGWQMGMAGDVPLVRGDKGSGRQAIEALRAHLKRKVSVLVFPQGTRGEEGAVGSFREGAFRLAIEEQADVVPLAVFGTERALPRHSLMLRPGEATVTVLPPVPVAGMGVADAPRLAETVRSRIEESVVRSRHAGVTRRVERAPVRRRQDA
ncbi:MAG: lysophospholipid acyltransferase family protein [Thermoanaerobaculia bacterium]